MTDERRKFVQFILSHQCVDDETLTFYHKEIYRNAEHSDEPTVAEDIEVATQVKFCIAFVQPRRNRLSIYHL